MEDAKTSAVATAEALQSEVDELRRRIGGVGEQDDTEAAEAAEAAEEAGAAGAAGAKPAGRPAASSPIYRKGVTSIPPTPTPFGAVAAARGEEKVTARGEMNRGGAETKESKTSSSSRSKEYIADESVSAEYASSPATSSLRYRDALRESNPKTAAKEMAALVARTRNAIDKFDRDKEDHRRPVGVAVGTGGANGRPGGGAGGGTAMVRVPSATTESGRVAAKSNAPGAHYMQGTDASKHHHDGDDPAMKEKHDAELAREREARDMWEREHPSRLHPAQGNQGGGRGRGKEGRGAAGNRSLAAAGNTLNGPPPPALSKSLSPSRGTRGNRGGGGDGGGNRRRRGSNEYGATWLSNSVDAKGGPLVPSWKKESKTATTSVGKVMAAVKSGKGKGGGKSGKSSSASAAAAGPTTRMGARGSNNGNGGGHGGGHGGDGGDGPGAPPAQASKGIGLIHEIQEMKERKQKKKALGGGARRKGMGGVSRAALKGPYAQGNMTTATKKTSNTGATAVGASLKTSRGRKTKGGRGTSGVAAAATAATAGVPHYMQKTANWHHEHDSVIQGHKAQHDAELAHERAQRETWQREHPHDVHDPSQLQHHAHFKQQRPAAATGVHGARMDSAEGAAGAGAGGYGGSIVDPWDEEDDETGEGEDDHVEEGGGGRNGEEAEDDEEMMEPFVTRGSRDRPMPRRRGGRRGGERQSKRRGGAARGYTLGMSSGWSDDGEEDDGGLTTTGSSWQEPRAQDRFDNRCVQLWMMVIVTGKEV